MAPAANTGKSRKLALADSDPESDGYEERLHNAGAARVRLREVDSAPPSNHTTRRSHPPPPPRHKKPATNAAKPSLSPTSAP